MRRLRQGGGTETAGPIDYRALAQGLRYAGIDPRHWLSYGTVCTMGADGEPDFTDEQAVYVRADGVSVDVLLMPSNEHVTARYSGVQGGASGTIYTPIHAGDEVVVAIPDGDLRLPPVVLCIMSGEHSTLPMDEDRRPTWKNDRILVHGAGVPVEVKTSGGGHVLVSGTDVVLNDGTRGVARKDDATKLTLSDDDLAALAARLTTGGGPVTVVPGLPVVFEGGEITSASGTVKAGG